MKNQPEYIIEKASIDDAEEILRLQKLAYISEAEIYDDFNIQPLVQTLDQIKEEFAARVFLKVILDGKIIGSVRASEKDGTCHIAKFIVHPAYQNRGIGTHLMNRVEELFCHCKRYELFTGHKSAKNLYLYQKLGYKIYRHEHVSDKFQFVYLQKDGPGSMSQRVN
jgi:GNAT superfamily N-acetyltransferase